MSDNDPVEDPAAENMVRDPDHVYLNTNIWGGLSIAIFGLIGWFGADDGAFSVWVFPKVNSAIIVLMAAAMVVEGLFQHQVEPIINKTNGRGYVAPMAAGLVAFVLLFTRLGWLLSATLLFGLAIFALQPKKSLRTAAVSFLLSGGFAAFFYYVFGNVFYVPWPEGTWIEPLLGG